MTITNVTKTIATVLPDGTEIKVESSPWSDGEHRIGEKKSILLEYTTDFDIGGFAFYINPALFMPDYAPNPITGKGSHFYAVQLPNTVGSGVDYPCTLQSVAIDSYLQTYQNFIITVTPDGINAFAIKIEFYMTHDMRSYVEYNGNTQIWKRFLNDVYYHPFLTPNNSNLGATDVGSPNIYATTQQSPRVYFYMEKTGSYPLEKISLEEKFVGFTAGYYYKNRTNTTPWFTNMEIEIKRGGGVVSNLSSTSKSNATIRATTGNVLNPITHFAVWIVRMDVSNLNTDFISGTESEFHLIQSSSTSTTKICSPMTNPTNLGSNNWEATFDINTLPLGSQWRFIGLVYSAEPGQDYKVNTFITPIYTADAIPTYDGNGFDARGSLDDYNRQFDGNNLECCIEERMRSKLKLNFPFNKWKNDIYNRLGLVVGNDIRRYLTNVYFSIYDTNVSPSFGVIQNIYDYKVSTKTGINTYSPQDGLSMIFDNTSAEFIYEWRNRFEQNTPCIGTLVNGVSVLPVQGVQYWGGKTLTIKWVLRFNYDDYSAPFEEDIVFFQQIRVKDYGGMSVSGYDEEIEEFTVNDFICDDEPICFVGILDDEDLEGYKLMTNIYPDGSGVLSVEEAEDWIGNQLNKLSTPKIIDQDEDYHTIIDETAAKFCVDGSKLLVNSSYVISALAKKYVDTGKRIIESGPKRITENKDRRIVEN